MLSSKRRAVVAGVRPWSDCDRSAREPDMVRARGPLRIRWLMPVRPESAKERICRGGAREPTIVALIAMPVILMTSGDIDAS